MAVLTTKQRNAFAPATFGLPSKRAYPVNDKAHARDAKARAAQQFNAGRLSASEKAEIDRKADAVLAGR